MNAVIGAAIPDRMPLTKGVFVIENITPLCRRFSESKTAPALIFATDHTSAFNQKLKRPHGREQDASLRVHAIADKQRERRAPRG